MPERVELWWARRQWSKGVDVPYPVGRYRPEWEHYPTLVRQYHPDLNNGIVLSQVPPAADVYLVWECDAGHRFVATPAEQRARPNGSRRRSTWCPECAELAQRRPRRIGTGPVARVRPTQQRRPARQADTDRWAVGQAFVSPRAPQPASAAEARLRQGIGRVLDVDLTPNAVAVARPFYSRFEVWPDIVIGELMVAIEYDTVGRDGLEHVGRREASDQRKDRLLRSAGWEVVRIRCGKLKPIGPHDLVASGVSGALVGRVVERLREIRGDLIVNAYLAPDPVRRHIR